MSKKKLNKECVCTPNCIYFPQEVPKEDIIEVYEKDGILYRRVKRHCMYEGEPIRSWTQKCFRGTPKYIIPTKTDSKPVDAQKDSSGLQVKV